MFLRESPARGSRLTVTDMSEAAIPGLAADRARTLNTLSGGSLAQEREARAKAARDHIPSALFLITTTSKPHSPSWSLSLMGFGTPLPP